MALDPTKRAQKKNKKSLIFVSIKDRDNASCNHTQRSKCLGDMSYANKLQSMIGNIDLVPRRKLEEKGKARRPL